MRKFMSMVLEIASEANKEDNARVEQLREVYTWMDRQIQEDAGPAPANLREALVLADFPLYFNRVLSRAIYDRYNYRTGQWVDYTYADTVPDYSTAERFRFSEFDQPVIRREKEEAYAGYIYEHRVQLGVNDYAKQIDFSHRILVNDDLGAFNSIITKLGDSARRFEDLYVSALYDNATTQASLVALGALYAGTGRLTTANLAIGWNAFVQRVDGRGNPMNVVPTYLVVPPILRLTADQILQSERIAELATNGRNVLQGRLQVREDPYIAYTAPNIPWYLFAAPSDVPAVSVVRMQSQPGIRINARAPDKVPMSPTGALGVPDWRTGSFLTGDIEIEVEDTIGSRTDSPSTWVGVTDENGIYYSTGTTP